VHCTRKAKTELQSTRSDSGHQKKIFLEHIPTRKSIFFSLPPMWSSEEKQNLNSSKKKSISKCIQNAHDLRAKLLNLENLINNAKKTVFQGGA